MALLDTNADTYLPPSAGPAGGHALGPMFHEMTLAGNITLDATYPYILKADPGGAARDITLDTEANLPSKGITRRIVNAADAAENLVAKNAAGDTIATINQNEEAELYNAGPQDGTDSAWVLVRIVTIALS